MHAVHVHITVGIEDHSYTTRISDPYNSSKESIRALTVKFQKQICQENEDKREKESTRERDQC